jgi:hypothetical protein
MISQINNIKILLKDFEDYVKTDVELAKLKAVDKVSDIASSFFSALIIFAALLVFALMLSVALALFLGHLFGETQIGFFIVAGVWGLICIALYSVRSRWPSNLARDKIVKTILD